jgi:hypothetical protein
MEPAAAVFLLLIVLLDAYALWRTWTSDASGATAAIWSGIVILLPLLGVGLWMFAGPKFRSPETDPDRKI